MEPFENKRPFEYVAPFLEALIAASNRSRFVLLILSTASILFFVGFWNSKQVSWMSSRIEVLSNSLEYLKGRKAILEKEKELKAFSEDCFKNTATPESNFNDSIANTNVNSNLSGNLANRRVGQPANKRVGNTSKANPANVDVKTNSNLAVSNVNSGSQCNDFKENKEEVDKMKALFIDGFVYNQSKIYYHSLEEKRKITLFDSGANVLLNNLILETEESLKSAIRIRRENVLLVHVPFFGTSFDIDDLSLISGITFTIILIWLRLSLWTELNSTQQIFERIHDEHLKNCYEYMSTYLVFTIPVTIDNNLKKFGEKPWKWVIKILIFTPATIQALVLINDLYTTDVGIEINLNNTIMVLVSGFFFLAMSVVLTVSCLSVVASINKLWKEQGEKIDRENREKSINSKPQVEIDAKSLV